MSVNAGPYSFHGDILLSLALAVSHILAKLFLLTPFQKAKALAAAVRAMCVSPWEREDTCEPFGSYLEIASAPKSLLLSYPVSVTSCHPGQHIVAFPPARPSSFT